MFDGECENVTTFAGDELGKGGHKDGNVRDALFQSPGGVAISSGGEVETLNPKPQTPNPKP
jgi:hypothetical protein